LLKFNRNIGGFENILDGTREFLTDTITRNESYGVFTSIFLGEDLFMIYLSIWIVFIEKYTFTLFCSTGAGTGMEVAEANERVAI
jgi:hypothetical protein